MASESPIEQAKKLHSSLVKLCPSVVTSTFPRPLAGNLGGLRKLCTSEELTELNDTIRISGAASSKCPICSIHALDPECDLFIEWQIDFDKLQWRQGKVTPCCRHCTMIGNVESMLNSMLAVDDDECETRFNELADHFKRVNQADDQTLQLALNLSHAVKVFASNLPLKIVDSNGRALAKSSFARHCIAQLRDAGRPAGSATGTPGGKRRKAREAEASPVAPSRESGAGLDKGQAKAVGKRKKPT